jgi:hypothetical protein
MINYTIYGELCSFGLLFNVLHLPIPIELIQAAKDCFTAPYYLLMLKQTVWQRITIKNI